MNDLSEVWVHKKTGGLYIILHSNSVLEKDLTPMVVYKSLVDGEIWIRPYMEFHDGRFYRLPKEFITIGVIEE